MKQKIESLNETELAWVKAQLESARHFVDDFSPGDAGQPLTSAALDRASAAWLASGPTDGELINAVINYVGMAFGQALVDGIRLQWVIATDEQGSELAVYGLPERGTCWSIPPTLLPRDGKDAKSISSRNRTGRSHAMSAQSLENGSGPSSSPAMAANKLSS